MLVSKASRDYISATGRRTRRAGIRLFVTPPFLNVNVGIAISLLLLVRYCAFFDCIHCLEAVDVDLIS